MGAPNIVGQTDDIHQGQEASSAAKIEGDPLWRKAGDIRGQERTHTVTISPALAYIQDVKL